MAARFPDGAPATVPAVLECLARVPRGRMALSGTWSEVDALAQAAQREIDAEGAKAPGLQGYELAALAAARLRKEAQP